MLFIIYTTFCREPVMFGLNNVFNKADKNRFKNNGLRNVI